MDDEAENRLLVDAFFSNLRLFTQATQSAWNRCTILGYIKHFCRVCLLKNECLIAIIVVIAVIFLLQYGRLFGRRFGVFFPHSGIRLPPSPVDEGKQKSTRSAASRIGTATAAAFRAAAASFVVGPEEEKIVIEERGNIGAAYAVQGRRGTMEDRFIIRENIGGSDVHLFAVFDGHGGSFSADFAKSRLLNKLEKEIAAHPEKYSAKGTNGNGNSGDGTATADCMRNSVNLVKLIKAEIAATDKELIKEAINAGSPSGTTALIALQNDEFLVVGNVGDSRGVMCCNTSEGKQNPVPLSYDHKPDQEKEKKRIEEAGGWIAFNGVWRVQGILAVSRALGDTLFKGRNIVTSEPDVLCFPLNGSLDPQFYILASDGLWDVFTNEGAMRFAHERFSKNDDAGAVAKALVMEGMTRGTMDNVCVVSVRLPPRDRKNLPSRRKSLSSPTLVRKASITKRVVSSDELERRNSGIIPDNVEIKYALKTVSEDDDDDQPK